MMRRRSLEITLDRLARPEKPSPESEQYTTPSSIASDMLWTALSFGDIQGKSITDLGCGNGILGIGAALLGASSVVCIDKDPSMIELARENALAADVEIETLCEDVEDIEARFDTVIQNPPFGAQRRGADRPFIKTAIRISDVAYSLHLTETTDFVARFGNSLGAEVNHIKNYKFEIPFMFEFHSKPVGHIDVSLLRLIKRR